MEAALAARATPLDRGALLRSARRDDVVPVDAPPARFASRPEEPEAPIERHAVDPGVRVTLPNVNGLPSRVAVRRLHALGLRVTSVGVGSIVGTVPGAGARVMQGDTIRLRMAGD
jgi:hypothetical protein